MIYGHMTFRSKSSAQGELNVHGTEVFCLDCNKLEELGMEDCGFDDAFGGVTDWRVGTECGGSNFQNAKCEVCGDKEGDCESLKNGDGSRKRDAEGRPEYGPPAKMVRAPEKSDLKVVCTKCFEDLKKELEEENA